MGWRGFIDEERQAVFFWSQKAACTTLFGFLADNMTPRPAAKKYFHIHSQPWRVCAQALERGFASVILVRHPVSRAISAYLNKFCVYQGEKLRTRTDLEPFAQELHDIFCARAGLDNRDNVISFEQYLDTVAHMIAGRREPHRPINGHWEVQMPPFLAETGFAHDHVIHVERLDAELGALARHLGMTHIPRVMNRTETRAEADAAPAPDYLGRLPAREVAARAFAPRNFITPGTLARIHRIYALDFTTFGYPVMP